MQPQAPQNHRVRDAILWMLSGFLILFGCAILQLVVHFLFGSASTGAGTMIMLLVNLLSALGGMVGVVLIPVGLILGIVKLSRA